MIGTTVNGYVYIQSNLSDAKYRLQLGHNGELQIYKSIDNWETNEKRLVFRWE